MNSPNAPPSLAKLGVDVEMLDEKAMAKLGMGALLGVGQGSERDSRLVVMRWNGAQGRGKNPRRSPSSARASVSTPGGISIKPAAGMEDMKGDMAGAACVVGLMHALASRKAKVERDRRRSALSRTCRTAAPSAPATS